MKKLFLSIGLMVMSLCVMAQTESSHLTFRGIPIDGNINAFVSKLEAKGYEKKKSIENGYIMEGSFMGRTCELYVFCSPTSRLATKVTAYYPKDNSWSSIKSDYEACKEQYTKKYGKPTDTFEFLWILIMRVMVLNYRQSDWKKRYIVLFGNLQRGLYC